MIFALACNIMATMGYQLTCRQTQKRRSGLPAFALLLLLAACTAKAPPPMAAVAPPPAEQPARLSAIHDGLIPPQAVWHLRSGLNVAALGCQTRSGPAIAHDYNRFQAIHRESLLKAHAETLARFRADNGDDGQKRFDQHMTRLYNHFAWPPAQARLCPIAAEVLKAALLVPAGGLEAYAAVSLPQIDQPVAASAFVDSARSTGMEIASAARKVAADVVPTAARPATPAGWRIQLGAFQGREAAQSAWAKLRDRVPGLAGYQPVFVPVPGKARLIRLQLDGAIDRDDALRLCAVSAGHGHDCIPVKPGKA